MSAREQAFSIFLTHLRLDDNQAWGQLRKLVLSHAWKYPSTATITPEDLVQIAIVKI
jgi:hypothetical protein